MPWTVKSQLASNILHILRLIISGNENVYCILQVRCPFKIQTPYFEYTLLPKSEL